MQTAFRRIALLLEYDGAGFAGSQLQLRQRSVQSALEQAISQLTHEHARVSFAGRTDSGVHASGQVATFDTQSTHDATTVRRGLNHFLDDDIVVRAASAVDRCFESRRDARWRRYRYDLVDGHVRSPLRRERVWHVRTTLDVPAMAFAAGLLPRHEVDWAPFAAPFDEGYPTVRTLRCCEVQRTGAHALSVTVEADGFLSRQVRRMVGALTRVGSGTIDAAAFVGLLDGPAGSAGPTAPARGLTLVRVQYDAGTLTWDGEEDDGLG